MSDGGVLAIVLILVFLIVAGIVCAWCYLVYRKNKDKKDICKSNSDCKGEGEKCDTSTGKCVKEVKCTKDTDCPGEYCGPGNFCQPLLTCTEDKDCASNELCNSVGLCIPNICPKNALCSSCNMGADPPSGYERKDYSACVVNWKTRADCKNAPEGMTCREFQAALCMRSGGCGITTGQSNTPWCYYCQQKSS